MNSSKRDLGNLIKNVYDDSTIDTLRQLDSNLLTMMKQIQDLKNVDINMSGYRLSLAVLNHVSVSIFQKTVSKAFFSFPKN
jgi:hypothetical protein